MNCLLDGTIVQAAENLFILFGCSGWRNKRHFSVCISADTSGSRCPFVLLISIVKECISHACLYPAPFKLGRRWLQMIEQSSLCGNRTTRIDCFFPGLLGNHASFQRCTGCPRALGYRLSSIAKMHCLNAKCAEEFFCTARQGKENCSPDRSKNNKRKPFRIACQEHIRGS